MVRSRNQSVRALEMLPVGALPRAASHRHAFRWTAAL